MLQLSALKPTTLKSALSSTALTVKFREIVDRHGNYPDWADLDTDYIVAVIKQGDQWEQIKITNIVQEDDGSATGTIDPAGRGILPIPPYTGYATGFGFGVVADVIFTNDMLTMSTFANMLNDNTFEGLNIFNTYAPQTSVAPVNPNDLVNLTALQSAILGTLTTINVILPAKAGETISSAGKLVYFDLTSNNWKLADADTASTVQNTLLGITQGAGTSGNPITGGVLLQGIDTHQSGMTEGDVQYASNTAGGISASAGTTEVTVGLAKSATELYFAPRFNQQMTEDQQDALDNALGGALSAVNPVVSSGDVSNAGVADKIVRANGLFLPALDGSLLTNVGVNYYTFGETITAGQPVYLKASDNKVYKASSASANELLWNYIGIAFENGTVDQVKRVYDKDGQIVTGLSLGNATTNVSSVAKVTQSDGGSAGALLFYSGQDCAWGFLSGFDQGNIEKVDVKFGANVGVGASNARMDIYEVTGYGGNATITVGASLGNVTITPTASAVNTFTFGSPITIKPNTHYLIKMSGSGGNGSNYFTIDTNSGSILDSFFSNGNASANTTITRVGALVARHTVYATVQHNYDIGDYIFLGDTAGSFSFYGGTKKLMIGRILSSSSILLGIPQQRRLIATYSNNFINTDGKYLVVPIPRNSVKSDFNLEHTNNIPATLRARAILTVGELETSYHELTDAGSNTMRSILVTISWGRGTLNPTFVGSGALGTFSGETTSSYFYK